MPIIKPKIFISHAWEDKALVRRLEAELKSASAEVWVDHSGVYGGDNLPKRISDALTWCDTVLLIWSEAASQSHWVELEWTNALSLRKTIIPCRVDQTPLPALLANVLYVDCRDFAKGFAQLRQALHLDPSATKLKPPPASTTKDRRIDAAVPSAAELGRTVDLRVQVRFLDSPRLGLEDWPAKNKPAQLEQAAEHVTLEFPLDAATGKLGSARLEIRVVAPDFEIAGQARQILLVPPDALSKCLSFLITPKRTGICRLNVEVYNLEHIFLGAIPIETEVGGGTKSPATNVANLFLFVTVGKEKAATRSGGTYSKTKKIPRPAPKIEPKEIPPPTPTPSQTATGVGIGGGGDLSIGGDVVGRDKIIINQPVSKANKSWIESVQAKLTLGATLLGIILAIFGLKDTLFKANPFSRFQTKVIDKDSNTGIYDVIVRLTEIDGKQTDQIVKTSSDGSFVIKIAANAGTKIRLAFEHPEYQFYDDYYETENPKVIYLTRRAK